MSKQINHKITLIIIWSFTIFFTLITSSFAYFKLVSQSEIQMIITKQLDMSIITKETTHLKNISPTIWSDKMSDNLKNQNISKVHFAVLSQSKVAGTYQIYLQSNLKFLSKQEGGQISDIKYKVYKDGLEINNGSFDATTNKKELVSGVMYNKAELNDSYVLFVYIEDTKSAQNNLQNLQLPLRLTGNVVSSVE